MVCSRCKRTIEEPKDGWNNCPKCGRSFFVGEIKVNKPEENQGEIEDKSEEEVVEVVPELKKKEEDALEN